MRYSGSKRKFMKQLLPILMEGTNENTIFVDAFGGGMNVVSEIPLKNKYVIELNYFIVELWNNIKEKGLENLNLPKSSEELTQEMYEDIKRAYMNGNENDYPAYLIGYVGACCSYGGAWFNGYARYNPKKNEDHIKEAYNGLKKQVENFKYLQDTFFICDTYLSLDYLLSNNMVIYADPPYMGTKKYESDFNHGQFWQWIREMTIHVTKKIYVSEYEAPDNFTCIWQANKKDGMGTTKTGNKQNTKVEKLFVYNGLEK